MHFEKDKAIYLQIADFVMEKIVRKEWQPDEKVSSVRELAAEIEVNPNTVMRAYDQLQQQEIIYNKRGLGFFVSPDATGTILKIKRTIFIESELPNFFSTVDLLGISLDEIKELYIQFKKS